MSECNKAASDECTKGCDRDDCRIQQGGLMITTAMYFPVTYNKAGDNINPDGNTTSYQTECLSCGKAWSCEERLGEVRTSILCSGGKW